MKPATRAGHGSRRLLPAVQQLRHSWLVDGRRGDRDAGEAGTEHATIATFIAASPRWGERARDRATSWRGALDDPGQSEAGGGGWAHMAAGRRRHRRSSGSSAVGAGRTGPPWRASSSVLASRCRSSGGHDKIGATAYAKLDES